MEDPAKQPVESAGPHEEPPAATSSSAQDQSASESLLDSTVDSAQIQRRPAPPPSPLTGCYLLIVVGEPHSDRHKEIILQKIAKGFLSWDINECHVNLEKELQAITVQSPEGEEARYGERLIQYATENLVTEVLIHPQLNTLHQCMRNLLSSFTKHRHIVHAGYTFAGNGSWILQDGTLSISDLVEALHEAEVLRVLKAYENSVTIDIHCAQEGDWSTERFVKEPVSKLCAIRVNPDDVMTAGDAAVSAFIDYLAPFLVPANIQQLLQPTDVVGNIRFTHPTLYVFPGGQGDAALFGINGFNMLVDGGFARKACFWDFARHLDRLDAVMLTRLNNSTVNGISAVLQRKKMNHVYPQIGHFFCNLQDRKIALSPDGDKDKDSLIVNLAQEGQEIVANLRHLALKPHPCYRDGNQVDPVNLYHKVGHGKLDMYVLSPARDSKAVKEFLSKWSANDKQLFSNSGKKVPGKGFEFPLQNLVSICALLVWQPANPNDTITRILFPGSTPQHKIFEGLDKLRHLEFLKHPVCSARSISPSASSVTVTRSSSKSRQVPLDDKFKAKQAENKLKDSKPITEQKPKPQPKLIKHKTEKSPPKDIKPKTDTNKLIEEKKEIERLAEKPQLEANKKIDDRVFTKDEQIENIEKEIKKIEEENGIQKIVADIKKIEQNEEEVEKQTKKIIHKSKYDMKNVKSKVDSRAPSKSIDRKKIAEKKGETASSPPTTPKKALVNGTANKIEKIKSTVKTTKSSPNATPAKSAKEANNRKVVEARVVSRTSTVSKTVTKTIAKKEETVTPAAPVKAERKPISRRSKASSPSKKTPGSPGKTATARSTKAEFDALPKKVKRKLPADLEKVATDSTVSTPSADADTTILKQEPDENKSEPEQVAQDAKTDVEVTEGVAVEDVEKTNLEETTENIETDEQAVKDDIGLEEEKKSLDGEIKHESVKTTESDKISKGEAHEEEEEEEEYLIITKEEYTEDSVKAEESGKENEGDSLQEDIETKDETEGEGEMKKLHRDEEDSEKRRKIQECIAEGIIEEGDKDDQNEGPNEGIDEMDKQESEAVEPEEKEDKPSSPNREGRASEDAGQVAETAEEVVKAEEVDDVEKKGEADGSEGSPGEKSSDKKDAHTKESDLQKIADLDEGIDLKEPVSKEHKEGESLPDEKFSTTLETSATTAPTLPEDERMPIEEPIAEEDKVQLDEIKEVVEEKYIKEETKEDKKDVKTRPEQPCSLTKVVTPPAAPSFEPSHTKTHPRDIVKTPDEVADLPVHEEVDPGMYSSGEFGRDLHKKQEEESEVKKQAKGQSKDIENRVAEFKGDFKEPVKGEANLLDEEEPEEANKKPEPPNVSVADAVKETEEKDIPSETIKTIVSEDQKELAVKATEISHETEGTTDSTAEALTSKYLDIIDQLEKTQQSDEQQTTEVKKDITEINSGSQEKVEEITLPQQKFDSEKEPDKSGHVTPSPDEKETVADIPISQNATSPAPERAPSGCSDKQPSGKTSPSAPQNEAARLDSGKTTPVDQNEGVLSDKSTPHEEPISPDPSPDLKEAIPFGKNTPSPSEKGAITVESKELLEIGKKTTPSDSGKDVSGRSTPALSEKSAEGKVSPLNIEDNASGKATPNQMKLSSPVEKESSGKITPAGSEKAFSGKATPVEEVKNASGRSTPVDLEKSASEQTAPAALDSDASGKSTPAPMEKEASGKYTPAESEKSISGKTTPAEIEETILGKATPALSEKITSGKITPAESEKGTSGKSTPAPSEKDASGKVTPAESEKNISGKTTPLDVEVPSGKATPAISEHIPSGKTTPAESEKGASGKTTPAGIDLELQGRASPAMPEKNVSEKRTPAEPEKRLGGKVTPAESDKVASGKATPVPSEKQTPIATTPEPENITSLKATPSPTEKETSGKVTPVESDKGASGKITPVAPDKEASGKATPVGSGSRKVTPVESEKVASGKTTPAPSGEESSGKVTPVESEKSTSGKSTPAPAEKESSGKGTPVASGKTTPAPSEIGTSGKATPAESEKGTSGKATPAPSEKEVSGKVTPAESEKSISGNATPAPLEKETSGKVTPAESEKAPSGQTTPAASDKVTPAESEKAPSGKVTPALSEKETPEKVTPVQSGKTTPAESDRVASGKVTSAESEKVVAGSPVKSEQGSSGKTTPAEAEKIPSGKTTPALSDLAGRVTPAKSGPPTPAPSDKISPTDLVKRPSVTSVTSDKDASRKASLTSSDRVATPTKLELASRKSTPASTAPEKDVSGKATPSKSSGKTTPAQEERHSPEKGTSGKVTPTIIPKKLDSGKASPAPERRSVAESSGKNTPSGKSTPLDKFESSALMNGVGALEDSYELEKGILETEGREKESQVLDDISSDEEEELKALQQPEDNEDSGPEEEITRERLQSLAHGEMVTITPDSVPESPATKKVTSPFDEKSTGTSESQKLDAETSEKETVQDADSKPESPLVIQKGKKDNLNEFVKSGGVADASGDENAVGADNHAAVKRMLVTASSEDGGTETEICAQGSIRLSKSELPEVAALQDKRDSIQDSSDEEGGQGGEFSSLIMQARKEYNLQRSRKSSCNSPDLQSPEDSTQKEESSVVEQTCAKLEESKQESEDKKEISKLASSKTTSKSESSLMDETDLITITTILTEEREEQEDGSYKCTTTKEVITEGGKDTGTVTTVTTNFTDDKDGASKTSETQKLDERAGSSPKVFEDDEEEPLSPSSVASQLSPSPARGFDFDDYRRSTCDEFASSSSQKVMQEDSTSTSSTIAFNETQKCISDMKTTEVEEVRKSSVSSIKTQEDQTRRSSTSSQEEKNKSSKEESELRFSQGDQDGSRRTSAASTISQEDLVSRKDSTRIEDFRSSSIEMSPLKTTYITSHVPAEEGEPSSLMTSSFYGSLPAESDSILSTSFTTTESDIRDHQISEIRREKGYESVTEIDAHGEKTERSYFYTADAEAATTTPFYMKGIPEPIPEAPEMASPKDPLPSDEHVDFAKAIDEHRTARGEDLSRHYQYDVNKYNNGKSSPLAGKSEGEGGSSSEKKTEGESKEQASPVQVSSAVAPEKKDPIEGWGKPLGLPLPPKNKNSFTFPGQNISTTSSLSTPSENSDSITNWGQPMSLPSPAPPLAQNGAVENLTDKSSSSKETPKKERKTVQPKKSLSGDNKSSGNNTPNRRSESPVKPAEKRAPSLGRNNKPQLNAPLYMDLTYVPHHGNSYYSNVEFFKRVRARYYVFSGTEPSKDVYSALLEAKQTWDDKELEVTIIPTYDTDVLGYWVAENEEVLAKHKIDLSPSASRCTINLQDHETSCSAYRLEF